MRALNICWKIFCYLENTFADKVKGYYANVKNNGQKTSLLPWPLETDYLAYPYPQGSTKIKRETIRRIKMQTTLN